MLLNKLIALALLAVIVSFIPLQRPHIFAMPTLPDDIKQKLYDLGVIDKTKAPDELSMLNQFWAFGLANKNEILEKGPMAKNTPNYASTGGWTLAKGDAMDHYSMHALIKLTPKQQELVEKASKNIYRPCCGNSTYFPDCNHGMAMLGILELMAAQGKSERELYATAQQVNTAWFQPQQSSGGGCEV